MFLFLGSLGFVIRQPTPWLNGVYVVIFLALLAMVLAWTVSL